MYKICHLFKTTFAHSAEWCAELLHLVLTSLTASSALLAGSNSSRDMVATNFSCKKKEEENYHQSYSHLNEMKASV